MTYTAIPDGDVDAESPGTTTLITLLRDNPIAITQGDAGAPNIIAAALATDSVEEAKIKNGAVTVNKLGPEAVETDKIKLLAVDTPQLAAGAVENAKIGVGAVDTLELAVGAVTDVELDSGSITKPKLTNQIHKVLSTDTIEAGNTGSGEQTLMTYTMPGSTLPTSGARLRITSFFKGNGADNIMLKFHFGSSSAQIKAGALIVNSVFTYKVTVDIVRTASNAQKYSWIAHDAFGFDAAGGVGSGIMMNAAIVIKFTGENTTDATNNAIVQEYMQIEYLPV